MAPEPNFSMQMQVIPPLAALGGIGRSLQAIAAEMTVMSQENLEAGGRAVEKLRDARSLPDALAVQSDFVKSAVETLSQHYPRIVQIAAQTPAEIARGYQDAFGKLADIGGDVANKASRTTSEFADQMKSATREAADKTVEASRGKS